MPVNSLPASAEEFALHLLELDVQLKEDMASSEDEYLGDEDEEMNEDEEDHEENEADSLNLNDEDLKDLEHEMDEMREEEEDDDDYEKAKESSKPHKKYPKSAVDDKFFSLAEMAAFLDEQDRMEGTGPSVLDTVDLKEDMASSEDEYLGDEDEEMNEDEEDHEENEADLLNLNLAEMAAFLDEQDRMEGTGPSVLDTVDDSETAPADYGYEDFFGRKDTIEERESANQKERKKKRSADEKGLRNKKKSVRFAMDVEERQEEDGNEELAEEEPSEISQGPVLLGEGKNPNNRNLT
ncbi:hypothetical protein TELCIR_10534 [Teladorsagia circumcincta]|uniref:Uncharacterized protein n=1 Tax=Teladorsagia circumcincta TaxID=45464 RepID=A0A2G9UBU6_TELCI|nr:hypothetical protein TELCIR_10534 [Teladorsagia circumcincta]